MLYDVGAQLRYHVSMHLKSYRSDIAAAAYGVPVFLPRLRPLALTAIGVLTDYMPVLHRTPLEQMSNGQLIPVKLRNQGEDFMNLSLEAGPWRNRPLIQLCKDAVAAARLQEPRTPTECTACKCKGYPFCTAESLNNKCCTLCRDTTKPTNDHHSWYQRAFSPQTDLIASCVGIMAYATAGLPVAFIPTPALYAHFSNAAIWQPRTYANVFVGRSTHQNKTLAPDDTTMLSRTEEWAGSRLRVDKQGREGIANPLQEEDDEEE